MNRTFLMEADNFYALFVLYICSAGLFVLGFDMGFLQYI